MAEEERSLVGYLKYILLIILNVFFLLFLLFLFMKKWITLTLFIILIFGNVLFYVLLIVGWFIYNKFFAKREKEQVKETDIIERKHARQATIELMKKDYSVLLDILGDNFSEDIIHLGAEDKPKTPIYMLKARDKYTKDVYRIAMRLDNPTKTVVKKNSVFEEFIQSVKLLAETSASEDVITRSFYTESGGLIKTEREVRRAPIHVSERLEEEKNVEVGEG
ncbi:MAG: hypothetical protein A3K77_07500 [Euryarchaeota archaeon RBG_13_31_8]|nr:MAG: hypothetical protein A3K77_07500 [Euryarchaeota archaeon RBG_13_31_8]